MKQEKLTEEVLGACFEVANELGSGFLESVYEKALLIALRKKNISVVTQAPVTVTFRGQQVGSFFADLLVEDEVIVELKAVKALVPEHLAQVINYLKATGLETALLVNFGSRKVEYRRLHNKTDQLIYKGKQDR
ncbi:GxxExxY protein [Deltaproteobacteria bacterium IMCC39524]|nr:GxxExxY protein [Deltaproteobacteria bacterium IMCC39524]